MYNHQKIEDPQILIAQVRQFMDDSGLVVSLLANISALLKQYYPLANWAGFYLAQDNNLFLGPFQGKSACLVIPFGKGVCGSAALYKTTQIVEDVTTLENHIACDQDSKSEIVVPIIVNDEVYGVLDIDASQVAYFDESDGELLAGVVELIVEYLNP